jgi:hypothetical protein
MSYEVTPDPKSWLDPIGSILQSDDTQWVYRGLTEEGFTLLQYIEKEVGLETLRDIGLVETEIVDKKVEQDQFHAIVRHKLIRPVIYPHEWTMAMWNAALDMFCVFNTHLRAFGLMTHDAHPFNILFDYGKPRFIDFGSLRKISRNTLPVRWHIEFKKHFLLPILVHNIGFKKLASSIVKEPNFGTFKQYYYFTPFVLPMMLTDLAYLAGYVTGKWPIYYKIIKYLSRIKIVRAPSTQWSDYVSSTGNWKEKAIQNATEHCEPYSIVFDVGGNKGTYTYDLAKKGKQVTVTDIDEISLEQLRKQALADNLPVATVKMDICLPTPRLGVGLFKENAFDRYRADLVIALAISHHLAFFKKLPFHAFANILSNFSEKYILTEYIDLSDIHVQRWIKKKKEHAVPYSRESFIEAFQNESCTPVYEWSNEMNTRFIFLFKKNE